MALANNYPVDTGEADKERLTILNQIYNPTTQQLGCQQLTAKTNQPILISAQEKSVLRLGVRSTANSIYQNTPALDLENFLQKLVEIEKNNIIVGFFHNFLVKGIKPA